MADLDIAGVQEAIRRAAAVRSPLRIVGGATKDFYGEKLVGDVLDVRELTGIVDYEPNELVITARAGTPIDEIESAMRASGQMLAFEPPRFAPGGTLGGAVASGLSGPRRPYAGAARDLVLGVKIVDGTGRALSFGGRVMKNVAGFDVSRLMTGAMGTLGVITEVSLKCLPLPRTEATRLFAMSADESIRRVNEWGGQPLPHAHRHLVAQRRERAVHLGTDRAGPRTRHRIGGPHARMPLGQVLGDRERIPDDRVAVVQCRHEARRREAAVRRIAAAPDELDADLAERSARELRDEPAAQRPRRVVLVADVEREHQASGVSGPRSPVAAPSCPDS